MRSIRFLASPTRLRTIGIGLLLAFAFGLASVATGATKAVKPRFAANQTLRLSAIPDQDPAKLNRLYGGLATYLSRSLGVPVKYVPVTDYTAAVSSFRIGDLDAVWFGGLTGVQARIQTPGSHLLAQRDIDAKFQSVFIANVDSGIAPIADVAGLVALKGHSLTFGSESSTSGRLMPQYFLNTAGVALTDLRGSAGFSGSHDATIKLVEAGTFEAGALNRQVWLGAVANGTVDQSKVKVIFESPTYSDYHWLARPDLDKRFGKGFNRALRQAIIALDNKRPAQAAVLELFGAKKFVPTQGSNYDKIEAIGRQLGLIR